MTALELAATELVRYAGAAARIEPIGTIAVPLRLVRDLRVALIGGGFLGDVLERVWGI